MIFSVVGLGGLDIRYAYLIIANKNKNQVQKLITMLDDSRNDIYLLVDNKSNLVGVKFIVNYSNIYYLKPINIYWGSYSQIQAELDLFKASSKGNYYYYHLLSGQGLPLVNQDVVHNFFDSHPNKEFIEYSSYTSKRVLSNRLKHHLFRKHYRCHNRLRFRLQCKINHLLILLLKESIPIDKIQYGSNWVSIDDELAHLIVQEKDKIFSIYKYGECVDELFIPILLNYYPNLKKKVFYDKPIGHKPGEFQGNMRYINWWTNNDSSSPYVWGMRDYSQLRMARNKGYLFSRKFDENVDNKIINKVFHDVMDI